MEIQENDVSVKMCVCTVLLLTMVQVLCLCEVFILAHYGTTTVRLRCHKNSWIYLPSTYYWWLLRPMVTIRFDSKLKNAIRKALVWAAVNDAELQSRWMKMICLTSWTSCVPSPYHTSGHYAVRWSSSAERTSAHCVASRWPLFRSSTTECSRTPLSSMKTGTTLRAAYASFYCCLVNEGIDTLLQWSCSCVYTFIYNCCVVVAWVSPPQHWHLYTVHCPHMLWDLFGHLVIISSCLSVCLSHSSAPISEDICVKLCIPLSDPTTFHTKRHEY